ncbi:MAG TPA: hypothetical protein VER96_26780 [Polyangiaceae bacterium]|nr:hypothetical protein [Polyangiaceae bacterium]
MARLLSVSGSVSRTALVSGLALLGCICAVSACKNQPPPAAEATAAEPPPPAPAATPAAAAPANADPTAAAPTAAAAAPAAAASKYSEAPFDVEIQPKGAYASGQAGTAEIVINAKPPFHANDKYPYKFKLNETPGLKYANLVVDKDAVKVEKTRATVSVPLTPEKAGKHTVSGKLFFSVCNDDQCLVEKRDLALEIDAK